MLSYRHAFHAGNHADVLKHAVLMQVLDYMKQKDKPFLYVDTHAGGGMYDLRGSYASKTREYEDGIGRIWHDNALPAELKSYVDLVCNLNQQNELREYPGSPWLASAVLRADDKMRLFELHSNEYKILSGIFARHKHIKIEQRDGFQALSAVLPPDSRRAVVLIDPTYEVKTDYQTVVQAVKDAHKRFASGVYLIWYPVVSRKIINKLERELVATGIRNIMLFELGISPDAEDAGMTASGMIVINPPWQLEAAMQKILPYLQSMLETGQGGFWRSQRLAAE
jgi:23S rRNA (adenine2030-N6)-methyltransferase